MTYNVLMGTLNSTHSLTLQKTYGQPTSLSWSENRPVIQKSKRMVLVIRVFYRFQMRPITSEVHVYKMPDVMGQWSAYHTYM